VIHEGDNNYVEKSLKITSKNNFIFLVGDSSLAHFDKFENITYVPIDKYKKNKDIKNLKNHFVNYSTNDSYFEWFCIQRPFIIKLFLEDYNLKNIFHIDSDNILLKDITRYKFEKKIATITPKNESPLSMVSSIHSALIDDNFTNIYRNLYEDIYLNKSKHYLIEQKINHHKNHGIKGGICDMTIYYLMNKLNLIDSQNLLNTSLYENSREVIFMNNMNTGEGIDSIDQFKKRNKGIKIFNREYVFDKINNKKISLMNIHFQGKSKKYLNSFSEYKFKF